jgi:hypothetical protein
MTAHDWFVEHRAAYVIRALEPDEERAFQNHLPGCVACRDEVAALERELAWLPMAVRPAPPRPGLIRALVEGALGPVRRERSWLTAAAVAASVALAVGAWLWASVTVRSAEQRLAGQQQLLTHELAMARDTLGIIREAGRVRHADITMDDRKGGMVIFADDRTHRWNVVVYGLPAPPPGEVCQFWFITGSGMVRGVEVKSNDRNPAFLTLPMPNATDDFVGAALTIERQGSSGPAPRGKTLAHLML